MSQQVNISFIGAGNVAWHLAQACEDAGYAVSQVYSRTLKQAHALCDRLYDSKPVDDLDLSASKSTLFIIAVPDKSIRSVAEQLILPPQSVLVHTSGSEPLETISHYHEQVGVFYPLQTFSKKRKILFNHVPVGIEAREKSIEKWLVQFAKSLTRTVYTLHTHQRQVLHIGAVFANNFANHCMTISKGLVESVDLDFKLLKPLLLETMEKCLELGPDHSQTGPAIRQDTKTIQTHLAILQEEPFLQELYKRISDDIIRTYQS